MCEILHFCYSIFSIYNDTTIGGAGTVDIIHYIAHDRLIVMTDYPKLCFSIKISHLLSAELGYPLCSANYRVLNFELFFFVYILCYSYFWILKYNIIIRFMLTFALHIILLVLGSFWFKVISLLRSWLDFLNNTNMSMKFDIKDLLFYYRSGIILLFFVFVTASK